MKRLTFLLLTSCAALKAQSHYNGPPGPAPFIEGYRSEGSVSVADVVNPTSAPAVVRLVCVDSVFDAEMLASMERQTYIIDPQDRNACKLDPSSVRLSNRKR